MDPGGIRSAERQGRLEVLDGLPVREDPGGAVGRIEICRGGLSRPSGGSFVPRDPGEMRDAVATGVGQVEAQCLGGPPMQQSSTPKACPLVGRVAEPAVAEVVTDRAVRPDLDLANDPAPNQLLERIDGLLL